MHRLLFLATGLIFGAAAILFLQPGTPGGTDMQTLQRTERPNILQNAAIDFTLPALEEPSLPVLQVTRNTDAATEEARVAAIVSFLNRRQERTVFEILAVHQVAPGDSLASIAHHYYGDATGAKHIYLANRNSLTPTHHIKVGQSLQIPVLPGL